jgi:hypothetical protein
VSQEKDEALAFARDMVRTLRSKLKDAAGVQSVTSDGLSVTYAHGGNSGLLSQLNYWQKQVNALQGKTSVSKNIDLSGGL